MGYYVRILSRSDARIPLAVLREALADGAAPSTLTLEAGTEEAWDQIVLAHPDGTPIASVERNPVAEGSLGAEELEEFAEEIEEAKPESAVAWLMDYFESVKVIYALQVLSGAESEDGWGILDALKGSLWEQAPGIIQSDGEGFSNESGYHILWQFSSDVSGPWWMGVLVDGKWVHFEMDLGDKAHRRAFRAGRVPEGVKHAD